MRDARAELRVYGQPEWELGFEAVTIHPVADDPATLGRLGITPESCLSCDLYWVVEDYLYFVAIMSSTLTERKTPFASYHVRADLPFGRSFHVVTDKCPITRRTLSNTLGWLVGWMLVNRETVERYRGSEALMIANFDVLDADVE